MCTCARIIVDICLSVSVSLCLSLSLYIHIHIYIYELPSGQITCNCLSSKGHQSFVQPSVRINLNIVRNGGSLEVTKSTAIAK